ncbi:MAG: ATP-binding cassette subfamily C protein CydC [Paraglaciecola sp.]|jgi:ATP-binding cassette subfamily C protein CydC
MRYWFNLLLNSQRKRVFIGIFWAFITAVSGVSLLVISGWFITATAITGVAISAGLVVMFNMYIPGGGIRFFALSRTVGRYVERIYNHDTILRLISVFRLSLFKDLSQLPVSQLRATSDSEWLSRLTADLDALDSLLLRFTIPPIVAVLLIFTVSLFVSFIWLEMALYLGVFLLFCTVVIIALTIRQTKDFAASSTHLLNECRADVIEHLQGAFELQAYQLMKHHERQLLSRLDWFNNLQKRLNTRIATMQLLLDALLGLGLIGLVITVLYFVNLGQIDGPVAVMLVLMFIGISEALQSLPSQFAAWGKTSYSAKRLSALVEHENQQTGSEITTIESISIELDHHPKVEKSHSKPLTLRLPKHELLLIKGRSGAGKSTLANLLVGIEDNTDESFRSRITVNDETNIQDLLPVDWYACLGYLTQSNAILAGTLGYNLTLGLQNVAAEQIWPVLKMVELDDWATNLTQQLDTWLGETGGRISGGQARRIGLARLLLRNPQLVILDEPFNGLDSAMASRIWSNISQWLTLRTVIVLTHEQPSFLEPIMPVHVLSLD